MKFLKDFFKKNKIISISLILIISSVIFLSVAMNSVQAAMDNKIMSSNSNNNSDFDEMNKKLKVFTPNENDLPKEEAINTAAEAIKKLFNYSVDNKNNVDTNFYRDQMIII